MKEMTREGALERLRGQCAAAETSRGEAVKRMKRWGLEADDIRAVLRELIRTRYIDDRRYARAYVMEKVIHGHWGRLKIRQGLYLKGVPRDAIDEAIASIDPDDYRQALVEVLRSCRHLEPERAARRAAGRGYEGSLIWEILKSGELLQDEES